MTYTNYTIIDIKDRYASNPIIIILISLSRAYQVCKLCTSGFINADRSNHFLGLFADLHHVEIPASVGTNPLFSHFINRVFVPGAVLI